MKEFKKAINQLGRIKKSPALDARDKKTVEDLRQKLYNKINNKDVEKMEFENLQAVYYDEDTETYELEFDVNRSLRHIRVDAQDHPKASTDEFYFDQKEVIEKIILEN